VQGRVPMPGLAPYIAAATVIAFAMDYCAQPFGTGLYALPRIGAQSESIQPLNVVDRTLKGDRLPGEPTHGQATSSGTPIGDTMRQPAQTVPRDIPRSPKGQLQDGCESALGPLTSAKQKSLAARCQT
jgi:hypothetical protein